LLKKGEENICIEFEKSATTWKAKKYLTTGEKLPDLM
jgi:hypothetical protein